MNAQIAQPLNTNTEVQVALFNKVLANRQAFIKKAEIESELKDWQQLVSLMNLCRDNH